VRSASALGEELAHKLEGLDASLAAMDAERALNNARKRRALAERATDPALRDELLQAAASYEDAARHTQSLEALRRRTYAQLDGVAASLENAAVRAVRIRVASGDDEGARAVSDALRVDVETLRETLAVFEDPATQAETLARQEPTKR
jgi:hypothetical protein